MLYNISDKICTLI